jgi:diguanylate cyclase (GGDEF)-like protein
MSARRRRRLDREEARTAPPSLPHYLTYPALGALLGVASPVGAFLLRWAIADPILTRLWIESELRYNSLFYWYMGVGTVLSFVVFGYALGLRSERLRVGNRILSARVEELHLKSVTDALTGTFTHGYLYEALELEIQHALTHKAPLSVMLLDLDDFKRINDDHGHLFGDRVLRETAETIVAHTRAGDIVGRYGGDEFMVIMPGADAATALSVAERARDAIAASGYQVAVSAGVATYDGRVPEKPGDLLHRADMNLYQAKRDGKNRVRDRCDLPEPPRRRQDDR